MSKETGNTESHRDHTEHELEMAKLDGIYQVLREIQEDLRRVNY